MAYKIKIIEVTTKTTKTKRKWEKLSTKEVARDRQFVSGPDDEKTRFEDVMGWTPYTEEEIEVEVERFSQTVEDLDLKEVIKAINDI